MLQYTTICYDMIIHINLSVCLSLSIYIYIAISLYICKHVTHFPMISQLVSDLVHACEKDATRCVARAPAHVEYAPPRRRHPRAVNIDELSQALAQAK